MHTLCRSLSSWSPHKRHLLQSDSVVPSQCNEPAATILCEPLCQICGLVVLHAVALPHHVKTVHPGYLLLDKDMTCKLCGTILIHNHAMDHHLRTMHAILCPQAPKKDPIRHILPFSRAKSKQKHEPQTVKSSMPSDHKIVIIKGDEDDTDYSNTGCPDLDKCHAETGGAGRSDIETRKHIRS